MGGKGYASAALVFAVLVGWVALAECCFMGGATPKIIFRGEAYFFGGGGGCCVCALLAAEIEKKTRQCARESNKTATSSVLVLAGG